MHNPPKNIISDDQLIEMIRFGGKERLKAIDHIYVNQELKMKIINHVQKMGGDNHEAQDVFHEGIIALDRNIRLNKFNRNTSLEGYLFSIARNIWNNMWRKRSKTSTNEIKDYQMTSDHQPESILFNQEQKEYLNQVLELLDDSCRKILILWKASYSMRDIAQECNLSSQAMAKKYRYRCMQKLITKLKTNAPLMEALRHV